MPRPFISPMREIRAHSDDHTLTVYQAYSPEIADAALAAGRFVLPFNLGRMTWVKPSFLWMMYRSGWATKPAQERVLAVSISRDGFEWALANSSLRHHDSHVHSGHAEWVATANDAPARIQWDPERSLRLEPLHHRAIQVGLSCEAALRYVREWTVTITDVTALVLEIHTLVRANDLAAATAKLPIERPYPLTEELKRTIGAS